MVDDGAGYMNQYVTLISALNSNFLPAKNSKMVIPPIGA